MAMSVRISSDLLDRIGAEARASDSEVCGILIGRDGVVAQAAPCRNVAADPHRRFEIDPAALLAAHRQARGSGLAVIGHYHSHPSGSPVPSARDAAEAHPDGAIWLIIAGDQCRAWRAVAAGAVEGRFDPVAIVTAPPCAAESAPPEERG
jgi:proteasome lid subunit RPN8/RPN11